MSAELKPAPELSVAIGPYFVCRCHAPSFPLLHGKWMVESDVSNRVRVFDDRESAIRCAKKRLAKLSRRTP